MFQFQPTEGNDAQDTTGFIKAGGIEKSVGVTLGEN
jgi:hypothetical protein